MLEFIKNLFVSLQPSHPPLLEKHWFVTPETHAAEYLFYTSLWLSVLFYFLYFKAPYRKGVPPLHKGPTRPLEHLFGLILIGCLTIQTTYNILMRPRGLAVMLHPCHAIASLELYIIYARNDRRVHRVFNAVVYYSFYTSLALLLPDTSALYLPYHRLVFWVQHWLVYLLPFYFITVRRFALDQDVTTFFVSVALSNLFFWNIELPFSLATSVNINYALFPSPGSPPFLGDKYYKHKQGLLFFILVAVHGFLMPKVFQALSSLLFPLPSSTPTSSSTHAGTNKKRK